MTALAESHPSNRIPADRDREAPLLAIRLAAHFAIEKPYEVVPTIAKAAMKAATLALEVRDAGQTHARRAELQAVVAPFNARVIVDPETGAERLRFLSPLHPIGGVPLTI